MQTTSHLYPHSDDDLVTATSIPWTLMEPQLSWYGWALEAVQTLSVSKFFGKLTEHPLQTQLKLVHMCNYYSSRYSITHLKITGTLFTSSMTCSLGSYLGSSHGWGWLKERELSFLCCVPSWEDEDERLKEREWWSWTFHAAPTPLHMQHNNCSRLVCHHYVGVYRDSKEGDCGLTFYDL